MRTPKLVSALVAVSSLGVANASAEVVLELLGPTELTVEPAIPYGPNTPLPADGESLLVWAEMTNTGAEVFEATGPGGISGTGMGTTTLYVEAPIGLWNPWADPDDPLVITPSGFPGISLPPGESFSLPILEVWGIEVGGPFSPAPVDSFMTVTELTLNMWEGFDHDPNDPSDPMDFVLPLDQPFMVTVVPEPTTLTLLGVSALVLARRRGSPPAR